MSFRLGDTVPVDTAQSSEQTRTQVAEPLVIEVFGVRWALTFHGLEAAVVGTLHHLWSRAAVRDDRVDAPAARPLAVVTSLEDHPAQADGEAPIVVGHEADDIPYTISRAVTLRSITRRRGEALMLHAVGVCGPDGATVVLVAPSGTGKTTAANALGKELGYVSDETIVVEDDGRISPYAKPLSIISDPDRRYRKQEHSPDDLGLLQPTPEAPPHLAAMVVLRRDTAATTPEFTSEGLIDAVLMVIPETSALPAMVDPLDRLCRALTQRGGPYKLRYAEIGDCVDLVRALTEADEERDAGAPTWEHHPGADREDPVPGPEDTDNADGATNPTNVEWTSTLTRRSWTDCIVSGGESILLHEGIPMRLSPLGTLLWLHADRPTALQALHDRVIEEIGDHPRAHGLVLEAAQLLVDAKILAVVTPEP